MTINIVPETYEIVVESQPLQSVTIDTDSTNVIVETIAPQEIVISSVQAGPPGPQGIQGPVGTIDAADLWDWTQTFENALI